MPRLFGSSTPAAAKIYGSCTVSIRICCSWLRIESIESIRIKFSCLGSRFTATLGLKLTACSSEFTCLFYCIYKSSLLKAKSLSSQKTWSYFFDDPPKCGTWYFSSSSIYGTGYFSSSSNWRALLSASFYCACLSYIFPKLSLLKLRFIELKLSSWLSSFF